MSRFDEAAARRHWALHEAAIIKTHVEALEREIKGDEKRKTAALKIQADEHEIFIRGLEAEVMSLKADIHRMRMERLYYRKAQAMKT